MPFSDLSSARFTAAISDRVEGSRVFSRKRPVIFMGGGGSTAVGGFAEASHIMDALIEEGYRVYQPSVPLLFGNDTSETRINDAITYAIADGCNDEPPIFVGQSNGALCALRWAAENEAFLVVALISPLDVQYVYEEDLGGFTSDIETAWGITSPTPVPTIGVPLQNAMNDLYDGLPIQIHYSSDDDFTLGTVEDFDTALEGFLENVTTAEAHSVGALGHTSAAVEAVDASLVVQFVKSRDN